MCGHGSGSCDPGYSDSRSRQSSVSAGSSGPLGCKRSHRGRPAIARHHPGTPRSPGDMTEQHGCHYVMIEREALGVSFSIKNWKREGKGRGEGGEEEGKREGKGKGEEEEGKREGKGRGEGGEEEGKREGRGIWRGGEGVLTKAV